jgi:hypothetical protein
MVTAELTFRVSAQDRGNITFAVAVSATGQFLLSTNITGNLLIQDADGLIAECPISQSRENNSLIFSFTLRKKVLPESMFAVTARHDIGKIAAGTVYCIKLSEFVKQ